MAGVREQQAVVRKLNLIWLGVMTSVPMIAVGLYLFVTVGEGDFGNELPVPEQTLWALLVVLVIVAIVGGRLVRSRLLDPRRLASGPIMSTAQEPETALGKAQARVLSGTMMMGVLLDLPGMVLVAMALYTTDVTLAGLAAIIHLILHIPMKPDFAGLLRDTLNAMEADH